MILLQYVESVNSKSIFQIKGLVQI